MMGSKYKRKAALCVFDGFFFLPYDFSGIRTVEDLSKIQPLPEDHIRFQKSVEQAVICTSPSKT